MATLIWKPSLGSPQEGALVRMPDGRTYTFEPGIPEMVIPEDVAAVTTALRANQGTLATPAAPTLTGGGTGGASTYSYKVISVGATADSIPSAAASTTPLGTAVAPSGVAAAASTNLTTATYTAKVSYLNAFGESIASANSGNVTVTAGDHVTWTAATVPAGAASVNFYLTAGGAGATLGLIGNAVPSAGTATLVESTLTQAPGAVSAPVADTTGGNSSLSSTNYVLISWPAVAKASGYRVTRTAGGATQGLIATLGVGVLSVRDTGLTATTYTDSVAAPQVAGVAAGPTDA